MGMGYENPRVFAVHPIVMEASTPEDRKYMRSMKKSDVHQINGALVQDLYKNTLDRKKCDFGDIPKSKGNIEDVSYYKTTTECLNILEQLMSANGITDPALTDTKLAISNCKKFAPQFETAFKTKQEFLMLLYNTMVMAIIDVTSMLTYTYMDYIVGPDQDQFKISGKFDKNRGSVSLDNLRKFNSMCANHTLDEVIDYAFKEQKDSFTGTGVVMVAGGVILSVVAAVVLIRELIFWYTKTKNTLADYLEVQSQFLEMHRLAVENSKAHSSSEKREIIKKQERVILKLRRTADKLRVQSEDADLVVRKELKKENSLFSLKNMEKSIASKKIDGSGVKLEII